jgi:hypothetical protein
MNLLVRSSETERSDDPALRIGRPARFEILSPSAGSLGLAELRIGSGLESHGAAPKGPLVEGRFDALVRVTVYRPVLVERKILTLPIERETPALYASAR